VIPDSVVKQIVVTDLGPVIQDVFIPGSIVTGAYIGNAVVPPLPNPNVLTCGRASLILESNPTKSDC
jgi:hypothetical protein